ncbi:MAG: hypothetical protein FJ083_05530 [Cyanobacteria bacterium K_Offshore_surface_m2_239]|nr:hypothetical protein [Cyanobacteria bacterium K_Offshore_surface_m2_239]
MSFAIDGFFGLIRALHERRAEQPSYQRLSFCFLCVATPYDQIRNPNRYDFNIGHAAELSGLDRQEAEPLLEGLAGQVADPPGVLDAAETGGPMAGTGCSGVTTCCSIRKCLTLAAIL